MRKYIACSILVVCSFAALCNGVIDSANTLTINFKDPNDAKAKATWSEPNLINVISQGLGWDGQKNACRDSWIMTKELAIGLSWRPTQCANITVELEPLLKTVTLDNGQTFTPSIGIMYVRHSPDAKHWSSWQVMKLNDQKASKYQYNAEVRVPYKDRREYEGYVRQYWSRDVLWKSDEEAIVKWIVENDPNFFEKPPPFIGYVQILYETCLYGSQRLTRMDLMAGWGVGGKSSIPKDENILKERANTPWRYRGS